MTTHDTRARRLFTLAAPLADRLDAMAETLAAQVQEGVYLCATEAELAELRGLSIEIGIAADEARRMAGELAARRVA